MSEAILEGVAIIGVHGRFPGAESVEEFWANLVAGRETVSFFSDVELIASGLDPASLRQAGSYVPARGVVKDAECFDAAFFGIHPKEAEVMDPQHRVFLEVCWEALERAGHAPGRIQGSVGVYAGAMYNTYYLSALHPRPELRELVGHEQVMLGNEKDYLATRVAYKLDLKGPAISMNTGCSSSLVAVCQAYQTLMTFQCDMALAGGVSIRSPQQQGYFYQEGNIASPDGHTRTFDAAAQGTVFSSGVTLVVLKRLSEALADGDQIYAVIKGTALNNDGAQRVSFGAPGVSGQSEAVALAQEIAGVDPDSISYVEAHGTATPIGDPIEVTALTKAFRRGTHRKQFCALGSVKSNIGHLDAAAGTAGLIKTALALKHRLLPPSLHFQTPNPKLDLENSPFFVNARLREWKPEKGGLLRAGVSSFGTGGTNAHVILEEAPAGEPSSPSRPWQILLLSAKTSEALEASARNLAMHLKGQPDANLADVAYTLEVGRSEFIHRRVVLCQTASEAVALLEKPDPRKVFSARQELKEPPVVFMFPGQGAQYVNMGADVYRQERVFRETVDECAQLLQPLMGVDLHDVLFVAAGREASANEQLRQTRFTQPALFTVEYALARLWMSWGIKPSAMIGHSVGEYVAGCLSGVFSLESALTLVARRAELVQAQAAGSMLAVRLPEGEIRPRLNDRLSIAAVNAPNLCVVSGPNDAIAELEKQLSAQGVAAKRLQTSHAFHSAMMDPVLAPFMALLRQVRLSPPQIHYVSNVTAQWVTDKQATSPKYWAEHVRQTVYFADGVAELMKDPRHVLLEVGPGQTLSQLARQHPSRKEEQPIISTLGAARDQELPVLLTALGRLWLAGATVDWPGYYEGERRRRVVLPTYPFERRRYYPESPLPVSASSVAAVQATGPSPSSHAAALVAPATTAPTPPSALPAISRRGHLVALVRSTTQDLSGTNLEEVEGGATFLEIGLDSLLLTQAATLFQRRFGVPVSFRQLMEDLGSIDHLAAYLDEHLPPDRFCPATPAAAVPVASSPSVPLVAGGSVSGSLEQLLEQQMKTTTQLLALVRGQAGTTPVLQTAPPAAPVASITTKSEKTTHGPFRPMERGTTDGLTEGQQRMLDELIASYTKRTAGSKRLSAQNRPGLADPRSAAGFKQLWKEMVYPIYTARSDGSRVWDVDGNEYIDFMMGFGASLFGHRPPFVVEAIQRQLELGFEIGPIQPMVGEAAALVRELTGMERVAFCNTGSEAVLASLRIARTVTGRDKVVAFAGDYHGIFDEVLYRATTINGEPGGAPIAPGIPSSATSQMVVLEYGSHEALAWLREHAGELAAVMVEPVQSRRLDLQPKEFLSEVRRITEQSNTALIFDEVVTGFRVHPGGAQAYFGVRADIATYGKVIGGGLPIGVVAGSAKYLDALDGGQWQFGDATFPEAGVTFFAGTFVRHPITIAVANAVLEHLKREGPALQEGVAKLAERAAIGIRGLIERYHAPLHLAQFSSLMYLTVQPEFKHGGLLFYLLRERGIHIFENRAFIFTTAHSDQDIEHLLRACGESLEAFKSGGFLEARDSKQLQTAASRSSSSIPAPAEGGPIPLTEAQRELWLAALMSKEAALSYNITFLLRLEGPLQREALECSLQYWMDRHDSLRAAFELEEPVQRIQPKLALELRFAELSGLPSSAREGELQRMARAQGEKSFDLSCAPLLRTQLVRLREDNQVLVLTVSHLIADGWSVGVLLHELKLFYTAFVQGRSLDLEPALQFVSYRQILGSAEYQRAASRADIYWRQQFTTLPPEMELPTDHFRPPQRSFRAARVSIQWEYEFSQMLRKASARQGATLFNFLLAGFKVLLHRLSGQDDLVVGVPLAGQISSVIESVPGSRALVGHCVNVMPVRSQCNDQLRFGDYLRSLRGTLLDAYEHQELTFEHLLQLLNIPRGSGSVPLVPIVFNLDRATSDLDLPDLRVRVEELSRSSLVFDVSINVTDNDRELSLNCDFNTDLFDAATVERWLGHFRTLLGAAAAQPNLLIADLPLLSAVERRQILEEWNDTKTPDILSAESSAGLHMLFERQASLHPEAIAVTAMGGRLTYGQLNDRANRLARLLRRHGSGPEVPVGLFVGRSSDLVVAMLAILKSGGAYVALDPVYPPDRIAYIMAEARAPLVVTESKLRSRLPADLGATLIVLDELDLDRESCANVPNCVRSGNLAYCLFTSGSTGRPKGVALEHGSAIAFAEWSRTLYSREELRGVLFATSVCFDLSIFEVFVPLSVGGKVIVAENALHLNSLAEANEVTLINTVPSVISELLEVGGIPRSVAVVNLAGEPLPQATVDKLYRLPQIKKVYDLYGPTEATTYSTFTLRSERGTATIGRPIANTQTYVLDRQLQPVPIGVAGELYIGGTGLARGYLHRTDLTAEAFVANPFSSVADARLYRTGDLARYLSDGRLQYLGRLDHQVKIRGFRIELGEIEAALNEQPGVRRSLVIVHEHNPGQKQLAAYIVMDTVATDRTSTGRSLQSLLQARLPGYMVPSAFVFLDGFPLSSNGKIDRKALPAPNGPASTQAEEPQVPRTPLETTLSQIFAEVLSLEQMGIHDNFFSLGGHSLLALRVVSRIRQQLAFDVPLSVVFEAPSVAKMAAKLSELQIANLDGEELAMLLEEIESSSRGCSPKAADIKPTLESNP